ncbi:hypothetical protein SAMN05216520_11422 [Kandleria vitulina]|jgi:hypothetical protein|uniref:hypothetical protein n=1 Tax=Kandleria vitulina TaxID=1630 RepID=UPI0008904D05|nr:hypothetical protein [Kandleria vitulina]SDL82167.1 hypothetical protein SAMN05216520_11422 [Kandleria vitulina]SEJ13170.1 hypothetical protein SAMN05216514_11152 [Kandleria vitulina]
MKRIKFIVIVSAFLFIAFAPVNTNAAYKKYTNFILYPNCHNNYTRVHNKETGDQYIVNHVTKYTNGITVAQFWACNPNAVGNYGEHKVISRIVDCKKGQRKTIRFTNYKKKGSKIRMAMEKSQKPRENANVSGEVDFR